MAVQYNQSELRTGGSMAKTLADFVREARARIREIDIEEFDEMIENHDDLVIVDVREGDEFQRAHIPGALGVPRGILESAADAGGTLSVDRLCDARDKTVVLYCQNGERSALATDTLQQMGFEKVYNLAGGIDLWQAEGFALVTD
jgi:rhodanese-related sulfurtransferase